MVRIAFVMDRVFRHFGLSGKSFIPLLISSGCGIPGIMASKTIEQDNDRRLTIMTATFIPCGAKLPVIALMGGVMAGYVTGWDVAGMMAPIMYFVGIVAVLVAAIMLKKTKPFSGKPAPFVMELPQYHIPSAKTVLMHVWERLKGFIIKAGTILFLACVVMCIFPAYTDTLVRGVEIIETVKPDTQFLNDRHDGDYAGVHFTSFDSALYYLPPMPVTVDGKVYNSKLWH